MRLLVAVTVVAIIASIAGWWVWAYSPARDQQTALEVEITDLQARESQLANQRQQLLGLQANAPEMRRSLDRLNQFIPPDPDQASFLELLQAAGNASGVRFTSLSFTDPLPVEGAPSTGDPRLVLGAITVTGTIDSSYFQLVDFLRRLEVEVSRAVLVQQVNVGQAESGFPTVTTTFTAQMFALIAAPVVETPEGTLPEDPASAPVPAPEATVFPVPEAVNPPTDPAQSDVTPGTGDPVDGDVQSSALSPEDGPLGPAPGMIAPATTGRPA